MNYIFLIPKLSLAKSKSTKSHLKFPLNKFKQSNFKPNLPKLYTLHTKHHTRCMKSCIKFSNSSLNYHLNPKELFNST